MVICPCNISPGDICPYWQYLSFYWPGNFLRPFSTYSNCQRHLAVQFFFAFYNFLFVLATFVHMPNILAVTGPKLVKKGFWTQKHLPNWKFKWKKLYNRKKSHKKIKDICPCNVFCIFFVFVLATFVHMPIIL